MIYDRILTLAELDRAASPLSRRLKPGQRMFYAPREVFASRYWAAQQNGIHLDTMAQLNGWYDIPADAYAILQDGMVYRVVRVQQTVDADELPVTVLELQREDDKYEVVRA